MLAILFAGAFFTKVAADDSSAGKQQEFSVWKTVELGLGDEKNLNNADDFVKALGENKDEISAVGKTILYYQTSTVSNDKQSVNLVRVTPAELGFTKKASLSDIVRKASKLGL